MQLQPLFGGAGLLLILAITGCGSSGQDGGQSVASSPTPVATERATTPTAPAVPPTTTPESARKRKTGEVDGVTFTVSRGSEATFTVKEQLARLPLPNDAVMRTTALSGAVRLDGRPSSVVINLQSLTSDERLRDQYVRTTMFRNAPTATFTIPDARPLPDGFAEGKLVTTQVKGTLSILGANVPMTFDVEARDDGDLLYVLGRSTFTWSQLGVPKPSAQTVISVDDQVRAEVLLALQPALPSGASS